MKTDHAYPAIRARAALLGVALTFAAMPAAFAQGRDVSLLASACFNCHGTDGRSPGSIGSIAGRPELELSTRLKAFKSDPPPAGTTIMNRIARGYSDADLEALAAYFSGIKAASAAPRATAKGDRK
jgi:sulfide dehydrogenase cytochrome subunit